MSFKTVQGFAGSAVATSGTITFAYPTNTNAGSFAAFGHKLWVDKFQKLLESPTDFSVSFGASNITVTYLDPTTIPAGSRLNAQFNILGEDDGVPEVSPAIENVANMGVVKLTLGAADVADADGVCASQAGTAATAMTINGALTSGGVATFDVPRNVVAAWTGTAVLTVTGTDVYGNVVKESSASGTSLAGKKAFKTITSVVPSANITSATVGTGDVLGLPVFLPGTAYVLKELQDGAAPTAGTVVAGVSTLATATTGDVRGTYDPNAACDGAKVFELIVALGDPDYKGVAQFSA
jgi:hypothetical protein